MRPLLGHVGRVAAAASVTISLQGAAILTLPPEGYGLFASFYIVLGIGSAAVYSLVSEPWVLERQKDGWASYSTALASLACAMMVPVGAIAVVAGQVTLGVLVGVAVFASIWRLGARFHAVAEGEMPRVVRADLLGTTAFVVAYIGLLAVLPSLYALAVAWAASAIVMVLFSQRFVFRPRRFPLPRWLRRHWPAARHLAADSALLEAGSAGTLVILAPLLGLAGFGVYRSISSTGLPVRLILNPLRPNIAGAQLPTLRRPAAAIGVATIGLLLGGACWTVLACLGEVPALAGSTIVALSEFKLAAAIFVATAFIETYYYLCIRVKFTGTPLLVYRLIQLVLALALPIAGFVLGGLSGAIWGFVSMTICVMLLSAALFFWLGRGGRPAFEGRM